jgi:iron complex transport system permease protein
MHRRDAHLAGLALLAGRVPLCWLGASVGSTGFDSVLQAHDPVAWQIVWDIRLPRTLGAWLAGALLGLAGAVAQGLFRNPLADPYLLGSASGAALGVAVALALFGVSPFATSGWCAPGPDRCGLWWRGAGVLLTLALAKGVQHTLRLLLAGVIVGVVLSAASDLVTLAVPDILQAMQAFMLGSTGFVGWIACVRHGGRAAAHAGHRGLGAGPRCWTAWRWARPLRAAWACHWRPCAPRWWRCWRWPPARRWRRPG